MQRIKIIALALMLTLITQSVYAFVPQPVSVDVVGTKYERAVRTLMGLGLIRGEANGVFEPDAQITRAEIAAVLVRIRGLEDTRGINEIPFDDVLPEHWAFNDIAMAKSLMLVSGYDNKFDPDGLVTFEQVLKMLVTVLGYDLQAQHAGGYPAGYISVAADCGISKGINTSGDPYVKKGDMALMLYNALDIPLMKPTAFGNAISYQINDNVTFLTEYHHIYKEKGRLTSNSKTALSADSNLPLATVEINGAQYKAGDTPAEDLLGYMVEAYYKELDQYNTIIFIQPQDGKNNLLTIDAKAIDSYALGKYSYSRDDSSRMATASLSSRADIIYNGYAISVYDNNTLRPSTGEVKLLDIDNDGLYDVVFITDYTNYVIHNISNGVIYDKYDPNKSLDLTPRGINASVDIKNTDGETVELGDLSEWGILSVIAGRNISGSTGTYSAIYSTKTVEGDLCSIYTGERIQKADVANETYEIADNYMSEWAKHSVGDTLIYCLDAFGRIAATKPVQEGREFAYLINLELEESMDSRVNFLLYNKNEDFIQVRGAKNIFINGVRHTGNNVIQALTTMKQVSLETAIEKGYPAESFDDPDNVVIDDVNQVIIYETNSNGEISSIQRSLPKSEVDSDVLNHISLPVTRYKWTPMSFAGLVNINTSTIVFIVPTAFDRNNFDESNFDVTTKSFFNEDSNFAGDAYYTTRYGLEAEALVAYGNAGKLNNSSKVQFVTKLSKGIDKDGNEVDIIHVFDKATSRDYQVKSMAGFKSHNISIGDGVRFAVDNVGMIAQLEKAFDVSERKIYRNGAALDSNNITSDFPAHYNGLYCQAYLRTGNVLQVKIADTAGDFRHINYRLETAQIYVYDTATQNQKLFPGTPGDIVDEVHSTEGSNLYIYTQDAMALAILVIK